jgi:cobalt transporter subunit CbtA
MPADGVERTVFTVLFNVLTGVAFAFIAAAAALITRLPLNPQTGLMWGLAGFATFMLAPSAGLPPQLPGMPGGDLASAQAWWWAAVAATAGGIALIALTRHFAWKAAAIALIALPHVIGAPQADGHQRRSGRLANAFAANAIAASAVFWIVLGVSLGYLLTRQGHPGGGPRMRKIPATVVTGFLGAGKTTIIRNLLAQANGRRIALIVNEFGDVGVDGEILKGLRARGVRRGRHHRTGQRLHLLHRGRRFRAHHGKAPGPRRSAGAHRHRNLGACPAAAPGAGLQLARGAPA